jgi:predicted nucleic acid-binding protein
VSRKWVVNASPLIVLGKVAEIALLERLCSTLVIPEGVVHELDRGPNDDPARIWVQGEGACFIRRLEEIPPLIMAWDLGKGETEVLAWAHLNSNYEAIVDDRAARNCASSVGIRVRGTLGIILLAKRQGLLAEVKPLFNRLVDSGLRIDGDLLQFACRAADEE